MISIKNMLKFYQNSSRMANIQSVIPILDEFGITRIHKQGLIDLVDDVNLYLKNIIKLAKTIKFQSRRKKLIISDINDALDFSGERKLYGYSNTNIPDLFQIPETDILIAQEKTLDLQQILTEEVPDAPLEDNFQFHWQLISGESPIIEEVSFNNEEQQIMPQEILWESKEYEFKGRHTKPIPVYAQDKFYNLIKQFLSNDSEDIYDTLHSSAELGILAPFYLKFISDFISVNFRNSDQLIRALMFTESIFDNDNTPKTLYSNSFISITMTLAVSPLEFKGNSAYTIRDEASSFLAKIVDYYKTPSSMISEVLIKSILDMVSELNFQQRYGALLCIFKLSQSVFRAVIVPKALDDLQNLRLMLRADNQNNRFEIIQLAQLYKSLCQSCYSRLLNLQKAPESTINTYESIAAFCIE